MERKDFESEVLKTKVMKRAEPKREYFWEGYRRGLLRGYHGEKFGSDEEHRKWWSMADDETADRQERGHGYRAGYRLAKMGYGYCTENFFSCEACPLVNYGRDCHDFPVEAE